MIDTIIGVLGFFWFMIKFLFICSIIIQYIIVIINFIEQKWKTKKEFLLHLIPCYPHGYLLKMFIRDAIIRVKDSWNKLK